jgi:TPR repeat protein
MVLDAAQLDKFINEAETGDGFAAFKLSSHFMSIQNDEQAQYWLLYAAARGYSVAQYNLWFELKDREDCKSKLAALAWLKSAALNGDKQAPGKLKEFAGIAQACITK